MKESVRNVWKSKPVVWGGDFNVNPHREDWSEEAWRYLRKRIGDAVPAGCRQIDVQKYEESMREIDGVNLCEYVIQDDAETTHSFWKRFVKGTQCRSAH